MQVKGKVSIDSDTLNSVVSKLNSSSSSLDSANSSLPGNFSKLSEVGYSDGITQIKEQLTFLATVHDTLAGQVSSHLQDTSNTEDELTNTFKNKGNYRASSGGNSGTDIDSGETTDEEVDEGKKIKSEDLVKEIKKMTIDDINKVIDFLDLNKGEITLKDLVMNYKYSKELYKTLLSALGYDDDISEVTEMEFKEVQKTLIDQLFAQEEVSVKLQTNSLLTCKEYLVKVAETNKCNVSDLLLEDEYKVTVKAALKDLYDGADLEEYNISEQTVSSFRTFVDGVASDNNLMYNEVLDNLELLL